VIEALQAFWDGAFGSSYALLSATLVRATPLILVGLAVAVAFRSGVLNIGAEGQLLVGAAAATAVALLPGSPFVMIPAMMLAGAAAGAAWAGVAAALRQRAGVLEVISTIMLNFIAVHLVGWLVRGPLQEPTGIYPQSPTIGEGARWSFLVPGHRVHVGLLVAIAAGAVAWWVQARTAAGFRARVVGLSARAAASAGGIDAPRVMTRAFLASGALAGLAGAGEVGGVTWALYEGISPGYGYTAIAVALLARLDARWVVVSGLFFGALEAGAAGMQRAGIPAVVVQVVAATVILGAVASASRERRRLAAFGAEGA
jgi:ABC-type uncharacterized transport system permease subunit